MLYSFEQLKKTALKAGSKKKGKKIGYSEYLRYDDIKNEIVCYRPMFSNMQERDYFIANGPDPKNMYVLAKITPQYFEMFELFTTMTRNRILECFNIVVQPVENKKFKNACRVSAADYQDIITSLPAKFEYGVGFVNYSAPKVLKNDPKKRKELNKLIREKRHMLKTRAKLGASFSLTPKTAAEHIIKSLNKRGFVDKDEFFIAYSPYITNMFSSQYHVEAAEYLLDLLKAAEPDFLDSLSAVVGFQRLKMFLSAQERQQLKSSTNKQETLAHFLKNSSASNILDRYNKADPMTKYENFEKKLTSTKPALREAYGADFWEPVTQAEAKEALGIPM